MRSATVVEYILINPCCLWSFWGAWLAHFGARLIKACHDLVQKIVVHVFFLTLVAMALMSPFIVVFLMC